MAAQSLVRKSYESPVETFNTNVIGTANLLDCLRSQQNEKPVAIVVVTSDKCYQNNDLGRAFCEADMLGGRDPYSSSKACAELVVQSFRDSFFGDKEHRLRVATGRAGNVIGGGDDSRDRLIPDAMRAFARGQAVNVRNPNSIRPWQHVLDPIVGYLTLCEQLFLYGDRFVGGWNFGPREEDTVGVAEVVTRIVELYGEGASIKISESEKSPHEASTLRLDTTKASEQLGWHPRWALDVSLRKTVEWYKKDLQGEDMLQVTQAQIAEFLTDP